MKQTGVFCCNNPNKKQMLYIATMQAQTNSTTNYWIVDLGATRHMAYTQITFATYAYLSQG
jgi:hypothetical protein